MVGYRKTRRAADPASTERSKSMSAVSNLATFVPGTKTPGSKHREILPFPGSLLARWDAGYAGDRSAQSNSRVLTPRERDVLAIISQGFSNKRIARTLAISPETVKTHVKRIFLKLAVNTRSRGGISSWIAWATRARWQRSARSFAKTANASGPRQICPRSARPRVKSSRYRS